MYTVDLTAWFLSSASFNTFSHILHYLIPSENGDFLLHVRKAWHIAKDHTL